MSLLEDPYAADALALRIIIAITAVGLQEHAYIVAEVRDPGEMDTVIRFTGGDMLETINTIDLNTRVSLSAVKQPGITRAFEEILGFDGDEFYLKAW